MWRQQPPLLCLAEEKETRTFEAIISFYWGHWSCWPSQVNHKHQNIARKGKGENVIGSFYCGQHLGMFCGWHNINPSGRIQCQFKFLTGLEVPIKTITLVCGWIFSPLIHNLHSWSWGSKFQVVRVSGFGSLSSPRLGWVRRGGGWILTCEQKCWSKQRTTATSVVFSNWIQFGFNYFWNVISERWSQRNVFTIEYVCILRKQRKYVRIGCEVIRTHYFCFQNLFGTKIFWLYWMKTFLRRKDFSVSASISPAEVLTLSAPRTTFAPLFSFREQQAPSRIIEIKHLHEEDKLIKAKHNTT